MDEARDMKYDANRGCHVLDLWAPIAMKQATAESLGHLQTILQICLLQFTSTPGKVKENPFIRGFEDLIAAVCDPAVPAD